MRKMPAVCAFALLFSLVGLFPAAALEIQVAGMGPTNVVSDQVTITVTWPTSEESYIILRVDGKFLQAQAPPCTFVWDTNSVADGEHELKATEVNAAGQTISEASIKVRVANSANVTPPVKLAYKFTEGQRLRYRISGETDVFDVRTKQRHLVPEMLYRALAGILNAEVTERVVSVADGGAVVERELVSGLMDYLDRYVRLAGVGRSTSLAVSATGAVSDGPGRVAAEAKFALAYLPLPQGPVDVGQTWQGPITVIDDLAQGTSREVDAKHRLVGFTLEGGEPCALIESQYRYESPLTVTVDLGERKFDAALTEGKRLTFFGLQSGRVVRMEETISREFTIKTMDYGIVAGATIPGVGGAAPEIIPEEVDLRYTTKVVLALSG